MKTKLAQRIAITYYKTKISTIGLVSPKKAAEMAFELFCTPRKSGKKPKEPPIFHKAEKLLLKHNNLNLIGIGGFHKILMEKKYSSFTDLVATVTNLKNT